jgi:hypothetical protein
MLVWNIKKPFNNVIKAYSDFNCRTEKNKMKLTCSEVLLIKKMQTCRYNKHRPDKYFIFISKVCDMEQSFFFLILITYV